MAAVIPRNIKHFRPDVEGMRAIAVVMVLLYHGGIGWASGGFAGVDVFFVISGFLITGLLVKELERDGRISLLNFYARRAKRLFPAAATVIVATALLAWLTLPVTRWRETGGDLIASAFYFINWRLASRSVDYLAEDAVPSFAQHFWSLAVEEQYYIVWPILLVLAVLTLRRFLGMRTVLWGLLALVAVPSLIYSMYLTQADPGPAYFVTTTRMWELAIGGAVAMSAAQWQRLSLGTARTAGWLGLFMVIASLLLISSKTPWPGYAAALPTVGTALMIIGGYRAGDAGPVMLLGRRPMVWIGGISYSLYLWHWPLIEATKAWKGYDTLPLPVAITVIAASIVLAWLTLKFIENPIRFSKQRFANSGFALATGLAFSLTGALAGGALIAAAGSSGGPAGATEHGSVAAGARSLPNGKVPTGTITDSVEWMVPLPQHAADDIPDAYANRCQVPHGTATPNVCRYGDPSSEVTLALVGDSKAIQWAPAVVAIAVKHGMRLVVYGKSSCAFSTRDDAGAKPDCVSWNTQVLERLLREDRPNIVLTSFSGNSTTVSEQEIEAILRTWQALSNASVHIVGIANNPGPPNNVYECVARNLDALSLCAFPAKPGLGEASMREAATRLPSASFISLNDAICSDTTCPAVIGNVLVYRQGSHLTRTYVMTLADRMEQELAAIGVLKPGSASGFSDRYLTDMGSAQTVPLPFGIKFPFEHRVLSNREHELDDGSKSYRFRLRYADAEPEALMQFTRETLAGMGYSDGRLIRDAQKGQYALNFRNTSSGARAVARITPDESNSGEFYLNITLPSEGPNTPPDNL